MHPENSNADEPAVDAELEGRLADAHAAVLAREAERRRAARELPPPRPRAQAGWVAAAAAAWLVVAVVLLAPPRFLQGAAPRPFAPDAGLVEPSLRYGVWLAQHRINAFALREGRLPSFLAEAGVRDSAISFEVSGERSYRLRASAGERILQFESGMSADSFLGTSITQLRDGP